MLKSIRTPIITIIVTLISGYLLFLFTRDKPDVRFTLSEGIPVSFPSVNANTTETVQQLEVKNLGTSSAEGISIRINAEIISYELAKNSNIDNVQIFDQNIPFEIFYTELSPQGSFTFVFTSKGQSVSTQELKISYSKGNAKEALSSETFSIGDIVGYAILIGYVLIIIGGVRSLFISSLKSTYDKDFEKIMLMKQPWYLSEKSWSILHFEIIEKKVFDEYFTDVEKSNFYKFLSFEKLEHIKKQEWDKLTSRAIERLNEGCLSKINNAYKTEMILTLLSMTPLQKLAL